MPEYLEIEGDLARIIKRDVVFEAALTDVLPHIETRKPVTTPALPDNTKFVALDPTDHKSWKLSVLIELPPKVRTLTMADADWGRTANDGLAHKVSLPYTIFGFYLTSDDQGKNWQFEDYSCYFSKTTLKTGKELMIPALLPNVFENGRICFGNTAPALDRGASLADRLNAIVNEWYLSRFTDIGHTRANYLPYGAGRRNYARWVAETEANPRCWENWVEFDPGDKTQEHVTPEKALLRKDTERITPVVLANGIPELPHTVTFGRAEEWLRGLTDVQRGRLERAFERIRTTTPDAIVIPDDDDIDA